MRFLLAFVFLGSSAAPRSLPSQQTPTLPAPSQQTSAEALPSQAAPSQLPQENGLPPVHPPSVAPELPPPPHGKSTVLGGVLQNVDLVRDQFRLKVFGGQTLKVLFDERTLAFRDGKRISVLALRPDDHVSVESTLDGTAIFALRIHLLSSLPEGSVNGQIVTYDPHTRELTIHQARSEAKIILSVPADTPVIQVGQNRSAGTPLADFNFAPGSIVAAKFKSAKGHGVATEVQVFAQPGSGLVFRGRLSALDLHAGRLVITDPETDQIHTINFDPSAFPLTRDLRQGSNVKVAATFTGSIFVATQIIPQ